MTPDLFALSGVLILALIQIFLFDIARTGQYGLQWNLSPRDQKDMPPYPMLPNAWTAHRLICLRLCPSLSVLLSSPTSLAAQMI
jgi:hypothetical protein